jgi:hypothetical protein
MMGNLVQADHHVIEIESVAGMISKGFPASWSTSSLVFPSLGVWSLTLAALILPSLLLWAVKRYYKMQEDNRAPFQFMELPQELRDLVYEHLIEDLIENPSYPPRPTCSKHAKAASWMNPSRWSSTPLSSPHQKQSNLLFLANKQIYKEYMDLLCKRATFHLTVSPQNCNTSGSPPPTTPSLNPRMWKIAQSTLKQLRSCDLRLITTSSMLGVTDPRNMVSSEWSLAQQIRQELAPLTNISHFTLDAKALGDPLWNPLWIWYHACQSFKSMGADAGPQLDRITFSLDTWSPGENYMARDKENKGTWTWYCLKGHGVGVDCGVDITIREFCGQLYQVCRVCRPESDSEDDG